MSLEKAGYHSWEKKYSLTYFHNIFSITYWGVRLTLPGLWTQVMMFVMWLGALAMVFLSMVNYLVRTIDYVNVRDFMHWQQRGIILFVAIIGAPLVASDVEGKSFLLYFSRPVKISQYILGKLGVLAFYFFVMILAPTLTMMILEYVLEEERALTNLTELAIAILCCVSYTMVIILTLGVVTLGISSLSKSRKSACFIWISLYFITETLYQFLTLGLSRFETLSRYLQLISYRRNVELLGTWIFSPWVSHALPPSLPWYYPFAALLFLSILSCWILVRQVQSKILQT